MTSSSGPGEAASQPPGDGRGIRLGAALRIAWVGYQRLVDEEVKKAGFGLRQFPDNRVLRLAVRSSELTVAQIGRELGMTRQGASKLVGVLKRQGFVDLLPSPDDRREKHVVLTDRGRDYLEAQRRAVRAVERRLRSQIGQEAFDGLYALVEVLDADDLPRLRQFLAGRVTIPYLD